MDHFYIIYLSCLSCHIFYDFFLKNWHFCELIMFQKLLELFKFRTNFSFWMFPSHLFKWSLLSSPLYYLGITKVSSQFIRHLKIYFEFSCNILVINVLSGLFQHVSYSHQAVVATWVRVLDHLLSLQTFEDITPLSLVVWSTLQFGFLVGSCLLFFCFWNLENSFFSPLKFKTLIKIYPSIDFSLFI